MNNAEQLVAQLRAMGRDYRSFEAHGFEAHLDGGKIKDANSIHEQAKQAMSNSTPGGQVPSALNLPNFAPTPGNVNAAAQFTVQIKRLTNLITAPLPVAVFAPVYGPNGWRILLQGRMPAGVTLRKVEGGEADNMPDRYLFTYTDAGDKVDAIEVTCTTAPYPAFLAALITDRFKLNKLRLTLSDPSQVAQYANQLSFVTRSMFGLGTSNDLVPDNFRSPQQYQAGIVDVDVDASFDKQTGIVTTINPVAGLQMSINCFASSFYQQIA